MLWLCQVYNSLFFGAEDSLQRTVDVGAIAFG